MHVHAHTIMNVCHQSEIEYNTIIHSTADSLQLCVAFQLVNWFNTTSIQYFHSVINFAAVVGLPQTGGSSVCVMLGCLCCYSSWKDAEELSSGSIFLSCGFFTLSLTWHHLTSGGSFDYCSITKHPRQVPNFNGLVAEFGFLLTCVDCSLLLNTVQRELTVIFP